MSLDEDLSTHHSQNKVLRLALSKILTGNHSLLLREKKQWAVCNFGYLAFASIITGPKFTQKSENEK